MDAVTTLVAVSAALASPARVGCPVALGSAAGRRAGGAVVDVLAVALAVGAAVVATRTLPSTRHRFPISR